LKSGDKAAIDTKIAALSSAVQKLGEKMSADTRAQQAEAGRHHNTQEAGSSQSSAKPDHIDAEFKEV